MKDSNGYTHCLSICQAIYREAQRDKFAHLQDLWEGTSGRCLHVRVFGRVDSQQNGFEHCHRLGEMLRRCKKLQSNFLQADPRVSKSVLVDGGYHGWCVGRVESH